MGIRLQLFLLAASFLSLTCKAQVSLSPNPVIPTVEGNDVLFTCSSDEGGPQLLQINSNVTSIGGRLSVVSENSSSNMGANDDIVQYQLSGLTRSDNGTVIQCFVNGRPSNVTTLIVDFAPLYVPTSTSYTVLEGSQPFITLQLDAAPRTTSFTWRRNGVIITEDQRLSLTVSSISFNPVMRSDDGQYQVTAVDAVGNGTATIDLTVYYAPQFTGGSGIISRSVSINNDITLSCAVSSANPPVSNLSLMYELTNGGGSLSNIDTTSNSFIIRGATLSNAGLYTCTATNPVAIIELTYNLTIGDSMASSSATITATTVTPTVTPPAATPTPTADGRAGAGSLSPCLMALVALLLVFFSLIM